MKTNLYRKLVSATQPKQQPSRFDHREHSYSSTTIPYGSRLVVKIKDETPDPRSAEYKAKLAEAQSPQRSHHCGLGYYQALVEKTYPVVDFSKKVKQENAENN